MQYLKNFVSPNKRLHFLSPKKNFQMFKGALFKKKYSESEKTLNVFKSKNFLSCRSPTFFPMSMWFQICYHLVGSMPDLCG